MSFPIKSLNTHPRETAYYIILKAFAFSVVLWSSPLPRRRISAQLDHEAQDYAVWVLRCNRFEETVCRKKLMEGNEGCSVICVNPLMETDGVLVSVISSQGISLLSSFRWLSWMVQLISSINESCILKLVVASWDERVQLSRAHALMWALCLLRM